MAFGDQAIVSESQAAYSMGFATVEEFRRAAERGRLWAAYNIKADPLVRMNVEKQFGVERCRQRWPEAYLER